MYTADFFDSLFNCIKGTDKKMKKGGFGKNKPVLITIVALVVLAAMILASAGRGTANWFENAVGAVLTPVQGFAARASNSIADFFRGVFNTTDADKENAKLKSELALYNKMQLELEELKKENERLRGLLEYSGSFGECSGVAASVTGRSTDIYFRVFTVNAGRNQGIDVDMPVICADGLVGRVTEVGATWSKVTAVIDAETSVPVMVERTRDNCMVRGVLNTVDSEAGMELYYLPRDRTDLVPGDTVITSGIGGIYPKGIKIGSVREVLTSDGEANAIISPSVDFVHIEEVFIITGNGEG